MSIKIAVGLQRKVGLPDYGSLGASCHVEFEACGPHLTNLEEFHRQVRSVYAACRQAVDQQLADQVADSSESLNFAEVGSEANHNGHVERRRPAGHVNGNGHVLRNGSAKGRFSKRSERPATQSQARAIRAIAGRQRIDLPQLLGDRFGLVRPEDLTLADASGLIDELKAQSENAGDRP